MALDLFSTRLATELPLIESALARALHDLPLSCQPVTRHIMEGGGKRLRPLLVILFAALYGRNDPEVYRLAISMEMLHAATLLHDDILDGADSRRGRTAAHILFGLQQTILAGDALLANGNAIVASFNQPELALAYSQATMQTAAGEILEMDSLGNPHASHADYIEIATGKTACLIAQACALGAIFAGAPPQEREIALDFGKNLGLAFQLVDDALDFAPESSTGKPRGGDLREGKLTPPLRLYRDSLSNAELRIFDQRFSNRAFNPHELQTIYARITPYVEETLRLADERLEKSRQALALLPQRVEIGILSEMAEFVRTRQA